MTAPATLRRREAAAIVVVLLALASTAWLITDRQMADMDAGPWTDPGPLGFYISAWVVMMAAMMLPSIVPMVLMFSRLKHARSTPAVATSAFVIGYFVVWTASGLVAYAALKAGQRGGILAWDGFGRPMAAGALLAAALYEMTPLKTRCLGKCRSPLGFLLGSWRDGLRGAFTMGTRHGAWCLGCCWALMTALFALGAMSLTWMLVVSGLIAAEKLLPWRRVATAGVSALLLVVAIGVAVAPASVPWLTVPMAGQMQM
ncbi:metal-binding protein [Mycobacterium sp. 1554424.7]|nr:metal-binding protein [Mycobacterium sp. 1554424.7]